MLKYIGYAIDRWKPLFSPCAPLGALRGHKPRCVIRPFLFLFFSFLQRKYFTPSPLHAVLKFHCSLGHCLDHFAVPTISYMTTTCKRLNETCLSTSAFDPLFSKWRADYQHTLLLARLPGSRSKRRPSDPKHQISDRIVHVSRGRKPVLHRHGASMPLCLNLNA